MAAFSDIPYVYWWLSGRYPRIISELHKKYGPIVRVAPHELSFASVRSYNEIYMSHGGQAFMKSSFYTAPYKEKGIVMERDPVKHKETRRLLAYGFSNHALKQQEQWIRTRVDLMVRKMEQHGQSESGTSFSKLLRCYTFDTVGELSLGAEFNSLESEGHPFLDTVEAILALTGVLSMSFRLPVLLLIIPFLLPWRFAVDWRVFWQFTKEQARKRAQRARGQDMGEVHKADFFTDLLREKEGKTRSEAWLQSQAAVLLVAGSDTTNVSLTVICYFLATNPKHLRRLQEELRTRFSSVSEMTNEALARLPYLQAVVEEGLRIMPVVSFGLPRLSPGAVIDGHYIPKGTSVSTPPFTMARDPLYFHRPAEFHPERYLPSNHRYADKAFMLDEKRALWPFSLGPTSCLGVNLAYLHLRSVIARLAWSYDWTLVNEAEIDWEKDTSWSSFWILPDVRFRFEPYSGVNGASTD